jgi:hypothetical protein
MTQNNLGIAYGDRIRGERADNLEQAIAAYHNALQVYTRDAFPRKVGDDPKQPGYCLPAIASGGSGPTTWSRPSPPMNALQVRTRDAFPEAMGDDSGTPGFSSAGTVSTYRRG